MNNPPDWNSDNDELEDELEGHEAFEGENEYEHDDEAEDDCEFEDEEPGEGEEGGTEGAAATGGCLRTMILAVTFWMAVAVAALGFCAVFGGGRNVLDCFPKAHERQVKDIEAVPKALDCAQPCCRFPESTACCGDGDIRSQGGTSRKTGDFVAAERAAGCTEGKRQQGCTQSKDAARHSIQINRVHSVLLWYHAESLI